MRTTSFLSLILVPSWVSVVSGFTMPVVERQDLFRLLQSTLTEEERMTEQDEEILFGDDSVATKSSFDRKRDKFGNVLPGKNKNPLDHAKDPLINKLHTVRETTNSCPDLWLELGATCPNLRAVLDEHHCDKTKVDQTFAQFAESIRKSAGLFQNFGVTKGTNVAILGENSAYWLMIDQGIQLAGGASAVRGADAPVDELRYIYEHSDSAGIAVLQGPNLLKKLILKDDPTSLGLSNEKYGPVRNIILMHRDRKSDEEIANIASSLKNVNVHVFADLLEQTAPIKDRPKLTREDLSTIVYTSGTTGHPKGVMLTHGNLLHQTGHRITPTKQYEDGEPLPGETMVSLLPVWHITERTFELWMGSRGCSIVYSSIRTFKKDLEKFKPQWMVLVPRVLEKIASGVQDKFASGGPAVRILSNFFTNVGSAYKKHDKIVNKLVVGDELPGALEILGSKMMLTVLGPLHVVGNKLVWSKVQDGFGGRLKVIISGGSALAGSLEQFYETAGLNICVGYGLTECSPLISYRRSDSNLVTAGCTGKACMDTELRVVDPDAIVTNSPRKALPNGQAGLVLAKGPQVMKGYYKNKEATDKAIDPFGWFDTGDLGRINPATGDLILTGRAKDTIVLSNGENIEPVPIEDAIMGASTLIDQVMLIGQDGRSLTAITVLNPSELANNGFLNRAEADKLIDAMEKVNDPKCTEEDCEANCKILNEASVTLRANKDLNTAIAGIFRAATADFRKWEHVSEFHLTLEPFAMANGLLTQSYKVKRAQVTERYANELPK